MKVRKIMGLAVLGLCLSGGFWALTRPTNSSDILLTEATAAPLMGIDQAAAVFVDITNSGAADRLISVAAPDAQIARFSTSDTRRIVPAESAVSLAADGLFIHLENISGPLEDGRVLPITLTFEAAGTVHTRARIVAPRTTGDAPAYGLFGIGDVCQVGEGEPAPQIALAAEKDGEGWRITVLSEDFEFTPHLVDGPHIPGTGHGHIYLNGVKLGRLYQPSTTIGALPPGQHDLTVTLSTNDHRAYVEGERPITAAIRLFVK